MKTEKSFIHCCSVFRFHSINVQFVVDSKQLIRDCVAQWPGSVHDARILRHSGLWQEFEAGNGVGMLLGDSGYPCKPWLLTPFPHPAGQQQEQYNRQTKIHLRFRNLILTLTLSLNTTNAFLANQRVGQVSNTAGSHASFSDPNVAIHNV